MGLSVWRETSKQLTVYRVCYTPIETLEAARRILIPADFGTALLTQSSSYPIVFGERNLPSPIARAICKSLLVYNTFGVQIWCNAKLLDS